MAVFHIVNKDYPKVAVRTVRNRRSADFLVSGFGPDYEVIEDECGDIRKKSVDIMTEHRYNLYKELEG